MALFCLSSPLSSHFIVTEMQVGSPLDGHWMLMINISWELRLLHQILFNTHFSFHQSLRGPSAPGSLFGRERHRMETPTRCLSASRPWNLSLLDAPRVLRRTSVIPLHRLQKKQEVHSKSHTEHFSIPDGLLLNTLLQFCNF